MPNLTTREILENQSNGLTPIKRQNPRYGEKKYYYMNPNRDKYSSLSEKDIAYVDSPDEPNPFLQQSSSTTGLKGSNSLNNTSSLTSNTNSYTGITTPFSTSTISTTASNSLTSPFSSSLSTTGLSTDTTPTTAIDKPFWYKGLGLSKTNSGTNMPSNNSLWNSQINPTTISGGQNITETTLTQQPNNQTSFMDSFSSSLKHDLDDTMYGAKRTLSGMTFGGSDWLLHQAGITDDDYLAERKAEGLDSSTQNAGKLAKYGGNFISGNLGLNFAKKISPNLQFFLKTYSNNLENSGENQPLQQNINVEFGEIIPSLNYIRSPNPTKPTNIYNLSSEMVHRINQAKSEANKMAQTGKELVKTYGSGAGNDIDNYFHAKLQCNFAKESPYVRNLGLAMGVGKEIIDLKEKYFNKNKYPLPFKEYIKDSTKDLKNNLYGSKMGYYNQDIPCEELLDHMRTDYMRQANIR